VFVIGIIFAGQNLNFTTMKGEATSILSNQHNSTTRFTPRELIKYHMEHPDVPITDEHIENLILDFSDLSNEREEKDSLENSSNINFLNKNNFTSTAQL